VATPMDFDTYKTKSYYDELFESDRRRRESATFVVRRISSLPSRALQRRQKAAEATPMQRGIMFAVYDSEEGADRIFPFDMVPRIVEASDLEFIERALKQRIR
jgi:uncharacterized circularly permuted ATP-grasp superfamily protein